MPLAALIPAPIVDALGWTFIHSLWQAALVGILLWGTLVLAQRWQAQTRYSLACAGLALLVVLPVATFGFMMRTVAAPTAVPYLAPQRAETLAAGGVFSSVLVAEVTDLSSTAPVGQRVTVADISRRVAPLRTFFPWIILFWVCGVTFLSLRLLGAWLVLQRLRTRQLGLAPEALQTTLLRLSRRLGVKTPVRLMQSTLAQVPMVVGWLRPLILVPTSAISSLTPAQLEMILAHELAHIRRHDTLINLLQAVAETVLFYHPAVWWVSSVIRQEREHCCDDIALAVCQEDRITYIRALAALELCLQEPPSLALAATGGVLMQRIRRLAGKPTPTNPLYVLTAALTVTLVVISAFSLPLAQARTAVDVPPYNPVAPLGDYDLTPQIWITAVGSVWFSESGASIERMAADAYVVVEERLEGTRRRVWIRQDEEDAFGYHYTVQDEPQPFDESARAWLEALLQQPQVARVFSEVQTPVAEYGSTLSSHELVPRVAFAQVGRGYLETLPERRARPTEMPPFAEASLRRVLEAAQLAAHGVYDDRHLRHMLLLLVDQADLSSRTLQAIHYAAIEFTDDEVKTDFLTTIAPLLADTPAVRRTYLTTVATIGDPVLRELAAEALAATKTDTETMTLGQLAHLEALDTQISRQLRALEFELQEARRGGNREHQAVLAIIIAQIERDRAELASLLERARQVLDSEETTD